MAYGNFFGDVSRGLATGVEMGSRMQRAQQEREEFEAWKKDRADAEKLKSDLAAIGQDGMVATTDTLDARFGTKAEALDWLTFQQQNDPAVAANKGAPQAIPLTDEAVAQAAKFNVKIPEGTDAPQAALPAPKAVPTGPRQDPTGMVVVQDPITHRWGVTSKVDSRPMTQREIAERTAAVYRAHGQADKATNVLKDMYQLEEARVKDEAMGFAQRYTKARMGGIQGLNDFFNNDFNRNNSAGIKVRVEQVENGQLALHLMQPGSVATDLYLGPDGISEKPAGFTGPELDMFVSGLFTNNLPGAYKDISDFRTAVQSRVIQGNQETRESQMHPLRMQGAREDIDTARFNRRDKAANTFYDTGIDLTGSFEDNIPTIMAAEGTDGVNGWNTVLGDDPKTGKNAFGVRPPKPLTQMTTREVYEWQRGVLLPASGELNSSAAGGLQLTSENVQLYGKPYWNQKFTPEVQKAIAKEVHAKQGYGAWEGLKRQGGIPVSPRARDQMIAAGGKAGSDAAVRKAVADYVAEGLKNMDIAPGSPERANAVAALQSEAMQLYGSMDSAPVAADMTSGGRRPTPAAKPAARPAPKPQARRQAVPQEEPRVIREARGALRLGGIAGERARERFEKAYGVSPAQAVANPRALGSVGRSATVAAPQAAPSMAQLKIDANAAILQGPRAVAEFKRKYGQDPQVFVRARL